MTDVSLTAGEALAKTQMELNNAMTSFDKWVGANPLLANANNTEYRTFQQRIKMLKLKMREIKEIADQYHNTLMVLTSIPTIYKDPMVPDRFVKSKDSKMFTRHETMKLGQKKNGAVSLGGTFKESAIKKGGLM